MATDLDARIEMTQAELNRLKQEELILKNKQYEHLIGKFIKIAGTCCVFVESIDYVTEYAVHFSGIVVYGGESINDFRVDFNGSESMGITLKPDEITQYEFEDFVDISISNAKKRLLKQLKTM